MMLSKFKVKRKIYFESVLVFFVAISPFIFKIYEYLPSNPDGTISILGFTIGSNGFPEAKTYVWFLISKILPLYLLIFWFLTSRDWWYHIILIPIAMYAFQLFEVIFDTDDNIDTENIWWLLPICMVIIPFVYFIRIKIYDKFVHGIDLEAMEAELEELKEKNSKDGYTSKASHVNDVAEDLKPESLSEEINRKLSTDNIEQGLKIFQDKLQNWFHFRF